MKGVILTPDVAKIFHPTPDIEGKKCQTPDIQKISQHPTPNFKKKSKTIWSMQHEDEG